MSDSDISSELQQQVQQAIANHTPLNITGGDSKAFLGNASQGQPIEVRTHRGHDLVANWC